MNERLFAMAVSAMLAVGCGGGNPADPDGDDDDDDGEEAPSVEVGNCCDVRADTGCSVPAIEACVCEQEDPDLCCTASWDATCVGFVANCEGYETACSDDPPDDDPPDDVDPEMSFFVTSRTVENGGSAVSGGDLDGLSGADAFCTALANEALPANGRTWRAYLSTTSVDARDRIGDGPWVNAAGTEIASSVDDLHENPPDSSDLLFEDGTAFDGSGGHDILTGSNSEGRAPSDSELMNYFMFPDGSFTYSPFASGEFSCDDWSSDSNSNYGVVGHVDWSDVTNPGLMNRSASWNASHVTQCSAGEMTTNGGSIRLYCFAE